MGAHDHLASSSLRITVVVPSLRLLTYLTM